MNWAATLAIFPFLFGRAFIEAELTHIESIAEWATFPFLFGRAFIEAIDDVKAHPDKYADFPSFLEGLSLRQSQAL